MTYTQDTIAKILPGVSGKSLLAAIRKQGLPAQKIGRKWYFDGSAVRQWLRRRDGEKAHRQAKVLRRVDDPKRYPDEFGGEK